MSAANSCVLGLVTVVLAVSTVGAPDAYADDDPYTLIIDSVAIEPGTTIQQGKAALIRCRWSAKFASTKKLYELKSYGGTGRVHVEYQELEKGYPNVVKVVDNLAKPGYYTPESPMKGEFVASFTPETASPAVVVCMAQSPG